MISKPNNESWSPKKVEVQDWTFRVNQPEQLSKPTNALLLLHGHLGNENVTWSLVKSIPRTTLMIAPRAPVKMGSEQYSWHKITPQWPSIDTYHTLCEALLTGIRSWLDRENISVLKFDIMGFSQGGVMAYALAILYSDLIRKVAALASFIPQSWMKQCDSATFAYQEFFIAHGTQDDIVPIKKAWQAAGWLEKKNAQVTFCEANTGHKISADCINGLGKFLTDR